MKDSQRGKEVTVECNRLVVKDLDGRVRIYMDAAEDALSGIHMLGADEAGIELCVHGRTARVVLTRASGMPAVGLFVTDGEDPLVALYDQHGRHALRIEKLPGADAYQVRTFEAGQPVGPKTRINRGNTGSGQSPTKPTRRTQRPSRPRPK